MKTRDTAGELSLAARWTQLSAQRIKWAFGAYEHFIGSLGEEMRAHFPTGDTLGEAYVVVFGRTQVGKTTLLLDLMGVSPQHAVRVSKVLRGGREIGKSATATVMEYRRSPDNRWRIYWKAEQVLDDDKAMEAQLGKLREHMSSGQLVLDAPVKVSIPASCFDAATDDTLHVRMLDLPGDNPRDDTEQKHVSDMAEKYVPNADLILLAGRADDLSFLNPDAMTLPRIRDWRIIPQRFRIVTTYSFTPDSQRKAAESVDGPLDAKYFRQRLREQIETFGRLLPESEVPPDLLFPLEFGDSWMSQAARDDGFHERIDPIVEQLKQQLRDDIKESATQYGRLRSAIRVHVTADNVKAAHLKQLDSALATERAKLAELDKEYAQVANRLELAKQKVDRLVDVSVLKEQVLAAIELDCQMIADWGKERGGQLRRGLDTNRKSFSLQIVRYSSDLLKQARDYRPALLDDGKEIFWTNITPAEEFNADRLRRALDEAFVATRMKLAKYVFDEYFPSLSNDFTVDGMLLEADMDSAARTAIKQLVEHWKTVAKDRIERAELKKRLAESHVRVGHLDLDEVDRRRTTQREAVAAREHERESFSTRLDREREASGSFRRHLDEAYLSALRERTREARTAGTPSESLLLYFSAAQMGEERRNILIGQQP
jgi:GTPase SAR1 family protein